MNGTGRVYKRGNSWWVDYSFRGKRYRESTGSDLKKNAQKLLRKRMAEMGTGKLVGPDEEKVTFQDLKDIIVTHYKVNKKRSLDRILTSWKALEAYYSLDTRALDLTSARVKSYILHRQEMGRANSTIRNELIALRAAYKQAKKDGLLTTIPHIPSPEVNEVRESFLTRADLKALVAELPEHLRSVTWFAYMTGWRKREILRLQWHQVDFERGHVWVKVADSKNKKPKTFPFAALPDLAALLEEQRRVVRALEKKKGEIIPLVFPGRSGKPIVEMRWGWNAACKRAGLEGTIFHDLRRCNVMNLERAGVSRSVAKSFTGHKTDSVYERYAIVDTDAQEDGAEKLARLYAKEEQRSVVPIQKAATG
ncbi:MAG: site-specific integrase [Longimicrobiales bacterium]|nr:site-specific integrase [Longimicrobiales bacterium]